MKCKITQIGSSTSNSDIEFIEKIIFNPNPLYGTCNYEPELGKAFDVSYKVKVDNMTMGMHYGRVIGIREIDEDKIEFQTEDGKWHRWEFLG